MTSLYYQPSGRMPFKTLPLTVLFAAPAIPLGWLYAWLTFHIPFVYLNFLITLGYAGVLAMLANVALQKAKARSPRLAGLLGLALGLFGWYCQWAAWGGIVAARYTLLDSNGAAPGMLTLALDPPMIWQLAHAIYENGIVSIKSATLEGGWLATFWLIELLIMIALPTIMGHSAATEPFCETSGSWAEKLPLATQIGWIADTPAMVQTLEAAPQRLLDVLPELSSEAPGYSLLTLYRCGGSGDAYVSISNVEVTFKDGKEKTSRHSVIEYLRIPGATADAAVQSLGLAAAA